MQSAATDWWAVFVVTLAGVACAAQSGKMPPMLPTFAAGFGLSLNQAAWLLSTFNLIGLAAGAVLGVAAIAAGLRRAAIGGVVLLGAASGLGGWLADSVPALYAFRFLEGVGFALATVSLPAIVTRVATGAGRPVAMALWSAFMPTGVALAMALTPQLAILADWRGAWLAWAAVLAAAALLLARVTARLELQAPVAFSGRRALADLAAAYAQPGVLLLALCFIAYTGSLFALYGFVPTILVELGFAKTDAGYLVAIAVACNAAGSLLTAELLRRGVPGIAIIVVCFVLTAAASFAVYADDLALGWRLAGTMLCSGASGLIPSVLFALTPGLTARAELVPASVGVLAQSSNIGQAIGPVAGALVATHAGGWGATPALFVVCAAIGIGCALALRGRLVRRD